MNAKHARFSEAQWYDSELPEVSIGGVGGIGSWLALFLGRIGIPMYIHDMDIVDETNMAGQFYSIKDIGSTKEIAVERGVHQYCGPISIDKMGLFTDTSFCCAIAFSAFDNMAARKLMFEAWKRNSDKEIFIDGRMLMEQGMIFAVTPDRIEAYEKHLFDDNEVQDQPCSAKAVSHGGAGIASLMTAVFTNYMSNKKLGFNAREVPFKFDYNYQLLMFEQSNE
jgi:molybdopterin/thiamine biosynthesis adenylyltransferase